MIYVTGDTHGNFSHIEQFCKENKTTKDDVMVILGDSGINYFLDERDTHLKEYLSSLPITFFCIQGNHEEKASNISTYKGCYMPLIDGVLLREEKYPNILFAKTGLSYIIEGKKTLVLGGAYSVDKEYRLMMGWKWFKSEQPSAMEKVTAERVIFLDKNKFDYVFSHTCPSKYEPREWFLKGIDQSTVDKSTEIWLDKIEDNLDYSRWYCGHFHGEKEVDKMRFLFNSIIKLGE